MSNRTRLSAGQRNRLASLGIDPADLGRVTNDAPTLVDPTTLPLPRNSDELADMIGDDARLNKILNNKDSLRTFIQRYADQAMGDATDLRRMAQDAAQTALVAFLRDNGAERDEVDGIKRLNLDPTTRPVGFAMSHKQATAYNASAAGVPLDKKFRNAAEYFKAIWHANPDSRAQAMQAEIRNAYGTITPGDGGFLVPETLRAQLLSVALENAVVRPRAMVVPMDSLRVPFPMIDSTSNVSSVYGGMVGYWTEESAQLVASQAKFGRVVLDAKKLTGYAEVPNELFADSIISFQAFIERVWPLALAWFEDVAFMSGSGAGEPLGFLGANNPATVTVTAEGGQPTATVVIENIVKMYARMLPASLNSAVWIVSPDVLPQLFTMALSVGTGGSAVYLTNAAGPAPMTILGRPVIVSEKASALGTTGDINFVDLGYYLVGDRQAMTASSSVDYKFQNDQTAFRIIQRVDGRPWIQSAITPKNNGNSLSPYVALATR